MKGSSWVTLGVLVIAVAVATASSRAQSPPIDRAYALVGVWTCQTSAASSATMTFARQSDGSIAMRNVFSADGGASGEFDEVYRLVTPAQYWSWVATLQGRPDFKEAATAGMWTAQKWFFDGTVTQRPHPHDTETHRIRMIYTWISDTSFEREFEIYENGIWRMTSSSVCRRKGP
jgi:hypothetical protein